MIKVTIIQVFFVLATTATRKHVLGFDSRLTLSIKVSVRLFSSYQNVVGISKSVSWGATLRSFPPGNNNSNKGRKMTWTQAWSEEPPCVDVLTHWAGLKEPALSKQNRSKALFSFCHSCRRKKEKKRRLRWRTTTSGWNYLFSRVNSHSDSTLSVWQRWH